MIKVQTKHIIIMSCPSLYHPTNIVNWVDHQIVRSLELRLPVECLSEYLNIGLLFVCLLPLLLLLRYTPTTHLTTHEAPLLRKTTTTNSLVHSVQACPHSFPFVPFHYHFHN